MTTAAGPAWQNRGVHTPTRRPADTPTRFPLITPDKIQMVVRRLIECEIMHR
jgi:hypothetical protein